MAVFSGSDEDGAGDGSAVRADVGSVVSSFAPGASVASLVSVAVCASGSVGNCVVVVSVFFAVSSSLWVRLAVGVTDRDSAFSGSAGGAVSIGSPTAVLVATAVVGATTTWLTAGSAANGIARPGMKYDSSLITAHGGHSRNAPSTS